MEVKPTEAPGLPRRCDSRAHTLVTACAANMGSAAQGSAKSEGQIFM